MGTLVDTENFLTALFQNITLVNVVYSIIAIVIVAIIFKALTKVIHQKVPDAQKFYRVKKGINYFKFVLIVLILIGIWADAMSNMSTYLGLLSAGVAIALRDLIINIAGWFFIVMRRPFEVGDRIEIGKSAGDVIDLRIFQFTLMEVGNWVDGDQSTGRIIHIPNREVFTEHMANYSKGFKYIWNELGVVITFESDWEKAKGILRSIADKHADHMTGDAADKIKEASRKYMIFYNNLTPIVYTSVKNNGIQLSVRYLCAPKRRRGTSQTIWEDILKEFAKHEDITLAYETYRITN